MAEEDKQRVADENKRLRAEIDNNTVKGLFAANSGGAVALLSLLPVVLGKEQYGSFSNYVVAGLLCMQMGIACAVGHNHMRRVCSLKFKDKNERLTAFREKNDFYGWLVPDGCVPCVWSHWWRRLSLALFVFAGIVVALGAWVTDASNQSSKPLTHSQFDRNQLPVAEQMKFDLSVLGRTNPSSSIPSASGPRPRPLDAYI